MPTKSSSTPDIISPQPSQSTAMDSTEPPKLFKLDDPDPLSTLTLVAGYPKLAGLMGALPDAAILRRFAALNAQNLLYFQAELTHLEQDLRGYEVIDSKSKEGDRANFSRDWRWLENSHQDGYSKQLETVLKIRSVLKEYNAAILQQRAMACLPTPRKEDLDFIQNWLADRLVGNDYRLIGQDCRQWGTPYNRNNIASDLITLRDLSAEDRFSMRFIQKLFKYFRGQHLDVNAVSRERRLVASLTVSLTTILASLLPVGGIAVLYCVEEMNARLVIISIFSLVFSTCLTCFSTSKRAEVFAATAAFAAVMVVFVGANGPIESSPNTAS